MIPRMTAITILARSERGSKEHARGSGNFTTRPLPEFSLAIKRGRVATQPGATPEFAEPMKRAAFPEFSYAIKKADNAAP
jgi:hypothetical protein